MAEVVTEVKRLKYCVNGEWVESATDKYMPVTDSSTGEVFAEAPCCTKEEVEEVVTPEAAVVAEGTEPEVIEKGKKEEEEEAAAKK